MQRPLRHQFEMQDLSKVQGSPGNLGSWHWFVVVLQYRPSGRQSACEVHAVQRDSRGWWYVALVYGVGGGMAVAATAVMSVREEDGG